MICNAFDSLTEFEKGVLKLQPLLKLIGFAYTFHLIDISMYKLCYLDQTHFSHGVLRDARTGIPILGRSVNPGPTWGEGQILHTL